MSARHQELFPTLAGQGAIAVDCETYDPGLKDSGPSYHRDGYIVGVAVATEAGFRHYFPVRHEPGDNLDARKVFGWLNDELADPKVEKVFANASYDLGFLAEAGVIVRGPLVDVQLAEPLINETRRSFSLESLAQSYLGEGKLDDALEDWITTHLKDAKGRRLSRKNYKGGIWRAPVSVVAPYAVGDVDLPLRIWAKQKPLLERLGLWRLFEMESSLIRMVLAMRRRGVAIDVPHAEKLYKQFKRRQTAIYKTIRDAAGMDFELWNARDLGRVFDALGVDYQRTSFTKVPSVTKEWLMHHTHPMVRALRELRHLDKLKESFVKGVLIEGAYKGRIHASFNQLRSDGYGTVSGRFSSSNPNLQQIPKRGADGEAIRACFIPDQGDIWCCKDYSQIEFRLLLNDAAHFNMRGAAEIVETFRTDPTADYHQIVAQMAHLSRDAAKTVNFGLAYGEGVNTLCTNLGLGTKEGMRLLSDYHDCLPFMRRLLDHWKRKVERGVDSLLGEVDEDGDPVREHLLRTLFGRIRRFNKYEIWRGGKSVPLQHWVPGARLAYTYAALNARIQGSAADILKQAMADIWASGVCDVLGPPLITLHDELDWSAPNTKAGREALAEVKNIMETVVDISVKLTVDSKTGPNWGCK